jgi:hypothetical protein
LWWETDTLVPRDEVEKAVSVRVVPVGADLPDRTDKNDTDSSLEALYYNGLRPFLDRGRLFFAFPVRRLQQKYNDYSTGTEFTVASIRELLQNSFGQDLVDFPVAGHWL